MRDAHLEKSGRTPNRIIKREQDGVTIEADQGHVRAIFKDRKLEQANLVRASCVVGTRGEEIMRDDGIEGWNRNGQQRRQMTHTDVALSWRNQSSVARPVRSQVRTNAGMLRNGKSDNVGRGECQADRDVPGWKCEPCAQWAIGATRCDDKCANTVLLETQGPGEEYASAVVTQ